MKKNNAHHIIYTITTIINVINELMHQKQPQPTNQTLIKLDNQIR